MRITVHNCRSVHNAAQSSSDNCPSYLRDNRHSSDDVYWTRGRTVSTVDLCALCYADAIKTAGDYFMTHPLFACHGLRKIAMDAISMNGPTINDSLDYYRPGQTLSNSNSSRSGQHSIS